MKMSTHKYHKKRGQAKVKKVMHEWGEGELKSSSGQKVTSQKPAIAIAMSEAGMSRKKKKRGRR